MLEIICSPKWTVWDPYIVKFYLTKGAEIDKIDENLSQGKKAGILNYDKKYKDNF